MTRRTTTVILENAGGARVRHPQYDGFIVIMLGFLLQWPSDFIASRSVSKPRS